MANDDFLQSVMDKCYDSWKDGISYLDFLNSLNPKDRSVVVCGNLNYQVENGGFDQWLANGYDEGSDFLVWTLKSVDTETSKKVLSLVIGALKNKDKCESMDEEDEDFFGDFETEFYGINQQFLEDVSSWYQKQT